MAEGRISWWSSRRWVTDRFDQFFSHSHWVRLSSGRVLTSVRRTWLTASDSFAARWYRSKVNVAFGRCSPIPAMNAVLMSELVSVMCFGSPPWAVRSTAKRATVSALRPSVANSTRPASRSAKMLT